MKKPPRMFAVLPTLLTLGNAACGFGSITVAAKVGPEPLEDINSLLLLSIAASLIFLAMLFDLLDGSAARWAKQTSDFGAQLDSLCDAISFGVAPAFLMLQFVLYEYADGESSSLAIAFHPRLLWVIAVLFVVCTVLRLARFNVETDEDNSHDYFSGLPSPAAAGTVASIPIAAGLNHLVAPSIATTSSEISAWLIPILKVSLPVVTLLVACLMVSRVHYSHVFNQLFRGKRNRQHVIQLVFTFAVVFVVHEMVLPLIFCYFSFWAPLKSLCREVVGRRLHKSQHI